MIINKNVLKDLNPCANRYENYLQHYAEFEGTVQQFLQLPEITYEDKIWVIKKVVNVKHLALWARACADSVAHLKGYAAARHAKRTAARAADADYAAAYAVAAAAADAAAAYAAAAYAAAAAAAVAAVAAADAADYATLAAEYAAVGYAAGVSGYAARKKQEELNTQLLINILNQENA